MCEMLTDSPSPSACRPVPLVPTRYAAISVLPWPGVSAWPAPSAAAVISETRITIGVRSWRKIDGNSVPPTRTGHGSRIVDGRRRRGRGTRDRGRDGLRAGHRFRVGDGEGRELRAARRGTEDESGVGQRRRDQVGRVGRESMRHARVAHEAVDRSERDTGAVGHDLAPADPLGERSIGVADLDAGVGDRRRQHRFEGTDLAHRREAADTRRERQPRLERLEPQRRTPGRQVDRARDRPASSHPAGVDLVVGHRAVAVEVEALARLERGDLGLVDNDIEQHAIGFDANLGVVVDREVAEWMRRGDRR